MAPDSIISERERVDLTDIVDIDRLIDDIGKADEGRQNPRAGLLWSFHAAPGTEAPALLVGVRGEVGALQWCDEEDAYVPQDGVNTDWVDYFTARYGHHVPMPARAEVTVRLVHEAVREFVRTGARPTCVRWRPE